MAPEGRVMLRSARRVVQWSCIALVVLGALPWLALVGSLVIRAVESRQPIAMSVIAWVVLLVPLWVMWFATAAWDQRHETAIPAVLMAMPLLVVTVLFMLLPAAAAAP